MVMLSRITTSWSAHELELWNAFAARHALSAYQLEQMQGYYRLLVEWNEKYNLTTRTALPDVIAYHLDDALMVSKRYDLSGVRGCADVGSGGGIPGIPLAIAYPHIDIYLIEVIRKKREFLQYVADTLHLTRVTVCDADWRTFLRSTHYDIQLFCARASLAPHELIRVFGGASRYPDASLVYWASEAWHPHTDEAGYIRDRWSYSIGERTREYVLFSAHPHAHLPLSVAA